MICTSSLNAALRARIELSNAMFKEFAAAALPVECSELSLNLWQLRENVVKESFAVD